MNIFLTEPMKWDEDEICEIFVRKNWFEPKAWKHLQLVDG